MGAPLLSYREVVAGYAEPIVGPVSFDLGPGDVLALVGPNGCGKSTLIGALTGASRVHSGEVARGEKLSISYQRQRPVRDVDVPLRADELLRLTGAVAADPPESLRPLLPLRVDRLSGGQFQLLTVWACLGGPSSLVVLDEPTNNMDPSAVRALNGLLGARGDRAVLVVTHDARFLQGVPARILEVGR